jgi:predicted DNA-binding transcriptional regulator YafY
MQTEIREAIAGLRILHIRYEGGDRVIEPHCLGSSSRGDFLLRAFQVTGVSSSGDGTGWKLLRMDRLQSVRLSEEQFSPRPDYNPHDEAMKGGILASVRP